MTLCKHIETRLVTERDFATDWLRGHAVMLGEDFQVNRKLWEFASIVEELRKRQLLRPGVRGLGFGVGREKLPSLFANFGVDVVATDLPAHDPDVRYWGPTGQHASLKGDLWHEDLCSLEQFEKHVQFRPVDMRAIPELSFHGQFDFVWSTSCFEHLGSLPTGLEFVKQSVKCLKPGGVAIHTTEYNVFSNNYTLVSGPVVIYRQRDIEQLVSELAAPGRCVVKHDWFSGNGLADRFIDRTPYHAEPHLKLQLAGVTFTSMLLVLEAINA